MYVLTATLLIRGSISLGGKRKPFFLTGACMCEEWEWGLVSMEETCSGICPIKRDLAKDLGERESILVKNLEREGEEDEEKVIDDGGFVWEEQRFLFEVCLPAFGAPMPIAVKPSSHCLKKRKNWRGFDRAKWVCLPPPELRNNRTEKSRKKKKNEVIEAEAEAEPLSLSITSSKR